MALLSAANRRIAAQREKIVQLEAFAQVDLLTGLPNRRAFEPMLYVALAGARRHREAGTFGFVDLDNFKTVNDTLGRDAGDEVLLRVAEILASQVRATDHVARYGGDEFVVLLTRSIPSEAEKRLLQIQSVINGSYTTHNATRTHVRASFGIVSYGFEDSAETLIQKADAAIFSDRKMSRRTCVSEGALTA